MARHLWSILFERKRLGSARKLVGERVDGLEAATALVEVAYGWQDLNSLTDE
jgi:hypothetical protein